MVLDQPSKRFAELIILAVRTLEASCTAARWRPGGGRSRTLAQPTLVAHRACRHGRCGWLGGAEERVPGQLGRTRLRIRSGVATLRHHGHHRRRQRRLLRRHVSQLPLLLRSLSFPLLCAAPLRAASPCSPGTPRIWALEASHSGLVVGVNRSEHAWCAAVPPCRHSQGIIPPVGAIRSPSAPRYRCGRPAPRAPRRSTARSTPSPSLTRPPAPDAAQRPPAHGARRCASDPAVKAPYSERMSRVRTRGDGGAFESASPLAALATAFGVPRS